MDKFMKAVAAHNGWRRSSHQATRAAQVHQPLEAICKLAGGLTAPLHSIVMPLAVR